MKLLRSVLVLAVVFVLVWTLAGAVAAHADGWQSRLSAVAVVAPNDGAALGAGLAYKINPHTWGDLFGKSGNGGDTKLAAGVSTDLQQAAQILGGVTALERAERARRCRRWVCH